MNTGEFDIGDFFRMLRAASEAPSLRPALNKLLSQPVESIITFNPETNWIAASGTLEVRLRFHPADGYHEFMAAFRAVFG